jgi:hypothetical protein
MTYKTTLSSMKVLVNKPLPLVKALYKALLDH